MPTFRIFPSRFFPLDEFEGAEGFGLLVGAEAEVVDEVIVEVVDSHPLLLLAEFPLLVLGALEHPRGQLCGDGVFAPGVARDQGHANELFAPKAVIGKGRVEIGESPVEERIDEPLERLHVDRSLIVLVEERQAHAAES
jgi:hypothetical protein